MTTGDLRLRRGRTAAIGLCVGIVVAGAIVWTSSLRGDLPLTTGERLSAARQDAVDTLRAVMRLHDGWPPDIPEPAVNDCRIDGQNAIQLTYLVVMHRPDDPKRIVADAADLWRRQGLVVDTFHDYFDEESGTVYTANARVKGIPHPSISASNLLSGLYVDSVCVPGDPDDYR